MATTSVPEKQESHMFPKKPTMSDKTSYDRMSDWRKLSGLGSDGAPDSELSPPYTPFLEPSRHDEFYKRYLELSQNVAQKYPNPGPPVERKGSVGASWRHVKEVQGYNSRVLYVDGLVRLYDRSGQNHEMRPRRLTPQSAAVLSTPLGGACRNYIQDTDRTRTATATPRVNDATLNLPGAPTKYKGFYKYTDY